MKDLFMPLISGWMFVVFAYAVVSILHYAASRREDDHIHFRESETQAVTLQSAIAHRIDVLEKWRKGLMTLLVVYGLAILALYVNEQWQLQQHAPTTE